MEPDRFDEGERPLRLAGGQRRAGTRRRMLCTDDAHLGLTRAHLNVPWREARMPTVTQRLGHAISLQTLVAAVRYPSDAGYERIGDLSKGAVPDPSLVTGVNVVVFRSSIRAPDRVRILGPTGKALQRWP